MTFNPSLVRLAQYSQGSMIYISLAFNPSLVRLALQGDRGVVRLRRPFNPSLVRLARKPLACVAARPHRFQSQLGSIGAPDRHVRLVLEHETFNPSLVRLALVPWAHDYSQPPAFNPSLVRLARAAVEARPGA